MTHRGTDLTAYAGKERTLSLTLTSGGSALDLSTLSAASMDVRAAVNSSSTAASVSLGSGITVTDAGAGRIDIVFTVATAGDYVYDVFVEGVAAIPEGLPLLSGVLHVVRPVTRS